MKRNERLFYNALAIGIMFPVLKLRSLFFEYFWNNDWLSQYLGVVILSAIVLLSGAILMLISLAKSEAWSNLTRENAWLALLKIFIFFTTLMFGLSIGFRVFSFFWM